MNVNFVQFRLLVNMLQNMTVDFWQAPKIHLHPTTIKLVINPKFNYKKSIITIITIIITTLQKPAQTSTERQKPLDHIYNTAL